MARINVAINLGYEYFVIHFSNIFFIKIFSNIFFQHFFFRGLFSMPPCFQRQNGLIYIHVMKNMIYRKRSRLDFSFV